MPTESSQISLSRIAALAGVSKATVSRVLSGNARVAPDTRRRVEAVMEQYNYRPNPHARSLSAGGGAGFVAALTLHIEGSYFAQILRGLGDKLRKTSGHLLCTFAGSGRDYIDQWQHLIQSGIVEGIVLVAPPDDLFYQPADVRPVRTVLCGCHVDSSEYGWDQIPSVCVDNHEGMTTMLEYLASKGAKRLIHLAGPSDIHDAKIRRQAFMEWAAARPGITAGVIESGQSIEDGLQTGRRFLADGEAFPDAFVCFNDSLAAGLIHAFEDAGAGDIPVTGIDGTAAAELLRFPTMKQPAYEMGAICAELIVGDCPANGFCCRVVPMELVFQSPSAPRIGRD